MEGASAAHANAPRSWEGEGAGAARVLDSAGPAPSTSELLGQPMEPAMTEDDRFAVETTAEIEVLRNAVAYLFMRVLAPMTPGGRDLLLHTFEEEFSDLPPGRAVSPDATAFHEAVAAAMPDHVAGFVRGLRAVAATMP